MLKKFDIAPVWMGVALLVVMAFRPVGASPGLLGENARRDDAGKRGQLQKLGYDCVIESGAGDRGRVLGRGLQGRRRRGGQDGGGAVEGRRHRRQGAPADRGRGQAADARARR
jgi:hypothetical protein